MKKELGVKVLNFFLRISSILCRFGFIAYLGKNAEISLLGEFSLINATVLISLAVLGFDTYIHYTREIVVKGEERKANIIFNQLISFKYVYFLFPVLAAGLFFYKLVNNETLLLLLLLIPLEHLGTELYRLLIPLKKVIFANFLFFTRNSVWALALMFYWYFFNASFQLNTILIYWISCSFISALAGVYYLYKRFCSYPVRVNRLLISQGYGTGLKFFIGTVAYKVIEYSDRYLIDFYRGASELGIYSLFSQFSNVLNSVIFTVVITLLYPLLFEAIHDNDYLKFKRTKSKMLIEVFVISLLAIIGGIFFLKPILLLTGKSEFLNFIDIYYVLLIGNVFFNISFVYHFIMIGFHKDYQITIITILGGVLTLLLNIFMIQSYGIYGCAYAKLIGFSFIFVLKYLYVSKKMSLLKIN